MAKADRPMDAGCGIEFVWRKLQYPKLACVSLARVQTLLYFIMHAVFETCIWIRNTSYNSASHAKIIPCLGVW